MNTEQMSPRDKLKEDARSLCRMEAMARFRIADEDMTPVIQASHFGFEAIRHMAGQRGVICVILTRYAS